MALPVLKAVLIPPSIGPSLEGLRGACCIIGFSVLKLAVGDTAALTLIELAAAVSAEN